jgi:allantoinase
LWTQLAGEEISFIASDHSPAPPGMKAGDDWFKAWGGISGCQTTLAALLAVGYGQDRLTLGRIAELTSSAAAQRFHIPGKGKLDPGYDADATLIDLRAGEPLLAEHLLYRHRVSPFVGHAYNLHGYVKRTILRGRTIFHDGRIASEPAGRLVRPIRHVSR